MSGGSGPSLRRRPGPTAWPGGSLTWGERTHVMAVVNLTPDSFSGDGLADDPEAAIAAVEEAVAGGADLIDLGAESTRPGHQKISAAEELERLLPVLIGVRERVRVPISIDTSKAEVAARALAAGADIINDVRGLIADPDLAAVVAVHRVPVIIMHDVRPPESEDVMASLVRTLASRMERAIAAGIALERIIVDPGLGFGKTWEQSLEALRRLPELGVLGRPVLVGASRKSMIGRVLGLPPEDRVEGTAATVALAIAGGADIVRIHDVPEMARVVRMSDAVVRGAPAEAASWEGAPAKADTTA